MKSTGFVRCVDEMGRFSIPKDLRDRYGIKYGDRMEVLTHGNIICLRKFDSDKSLAEMLDRLEEYVRTQCRELQDKGSVIARIREIKESISEEGEN